MNLPETWSEMVVFDQVSDLDSVMEFGCNNLQTGCRNPSTSVVSPPRVLHCKQSMASGKTKEDGRASLIQSHAVYVEGPAAAVCYTQLVP